MRNHQATSHAKDKYFKAKADPAALSCGTCHRGKEEPELFVP